MWSLTVFPWNCFFWFSLQLGSWSCFSSVLATKHFLHHNFVVRQHQGAKFGKLFRFQVGDRRGKSGIKRVDTFGKAGFAAKELVYLSLGRTLVGFHTLTIRDVVSYFPCRTKLYWRSVQVVRAGETKCRDGPPVGAQLFDNLWAFWGGWRDLEDTEVRVAVSLGSYRTRRTRQPNESGMRETVQRREPTGETCDGCGGALPLSERA